MQTTLIKVEVFKNMDTRYLKKGEKNKIYTNKKKRRYVCEVGLVAGQFDVGMENEKVQREK